MDPRIQRLLAAMEENPSGRLTLKAMAEFAGLSSSRLRHKFKSEVGMTPTVYLQVLRLRIAKELLRDRLLSVKEVRAAVGIESASYFTHKFKRTYGITPSKSRELLDARSASLVDGAER